MKRITIITGMALALGASSAFADVTAQTGVYVGGDLGWSFPENPSKNTVSASSVSNRNFTWGGTLGFNYAINQNFMAGVEVGYQNFGKNTYSYSSSGLSIATKNYGVQILATATYLMSNGFNVFGKLGAIDQTTNASGSFIGFSADKDFTQWLPAAAIGVGYMPTQNVNIALQYERTFGADWDNKTTFNTTNPKPMTQNAFTLGVTYTFPI